MELWFKLHQCTWKLLDITQNGLKFGKRRGSLRQSGGLVVLIGRGQRAEVEEQLQRAWEYE
jgi:hypothetical protein